MEIQATTREWLAESNQQIADALAEIADGQAIQNQLMHEQIKALKQLTDAVNDLVDKPTLADLKCDFTQWNLVEAITNLSAIIENKNTSEDIQITKEEMEQVLNNDFNLDPLI